MKLKALSPTWSLILIFWIVSNSGRLGAEPKNEAFIGSFVKTGGSGGISCFVIEHHKGPYYVMFDNLGAVWAGKSSGKRIVFNGGLLNLIFEISGAQRYSFYGQMENQPGSRVNTSTFARGKCQI